MDSLSLKIAYFITKNKIFFKRLLIFSIFFLDIFLVYQFGLRLVIYQSQTLMHEEYLRQLSVNYINFDFLRTINQPIPLQINSTAVVRDKGGDYDFVATVKNSNETWFAKSFEYRFLVPGKFTTEYFKTFLLPHQEKYLIAFRQNYTGDIKKVELEIRDVSWQRVKEQQREILGILDKLKTQHGKVELTKEGNSYLAFSVKNNSVYDFWTVGWQIVLYQYKRVVATNYIFTDQLKSQEERDVLISWLDRLGQVDRIDIKPDINLFDENIFMKPKIKDLYPLLRPNE